MPNARDYFFLSAAILIVDYYFGNFIISSLGCSLLFIKFFLRDMSVSYIFLFNIFYFIFTSPSLCLFFFYFLIEGPGTHLYHCKYVTIFSSMYARVCVRREINPALVILGHVSSLLSYLCRDT